MPRGHGPRGGRGPGARHRPAEGAARRGPPGAPGLAALPLGRQRLVRGDSANDLLGITLDPNVLIQETKAGTCDVRAGRRPPARRCWRTSRTTAVGPGWRGSTAPPTSRARRRGAEGRDSATNGLFGPIDPAKEAGYADPPRARASSPTPACASAARRARWPARSGTSSPSEGYDLLGMSYDNTGALGASTWRHVAFVEQSARGDARGRVDLGMPAVGPPGGPPGGAPGPTGRCAWRCAGPTRAGDGGPGGERPDFRWLMSSDVCKHCTHAACLDVCPTGSLFRTEFGTVVVQDDICNGCGYCVPACPYGVIERRKGPERGAQRRHRPEVHALLRPARRRDGAGLRQGVPHGLHPVRRPRRAARAAAGRRVGQAPGRGRGARPASTATTRTTAWAAPGRSSCCSTSPRSTACRRTRSSPPATCRSMFNRAATAAAALFSAARRGVPGEAVSADDERRRCRTRARGRPAGARRRRQGRWAGTAGVAAGRRAVRGGERAMVPPAEFSLLLRPAGRQAVAVGDRHPGLHLRRRARRRLLPAGGGRPTSPVGPPCAAAAGSARSALWASPSQPSSTTWAGRPGSATCCEPPS